MDKIDIICLIIIICMIIWIHYMLIHEIYLAYQNPSIDWKNYSYVLQNSWSNAV